MLRSFYTLSLRLYAFLLSVIARFHPKAKQWVIGRKDWDKKLAEQVHLNHQWIWFHCASLGEFEDGRSVIEAIKKLYPHYRILLTFFSPSGYEVRKHYAFSNYVCYLPIDTPRNAKRFLDILQPKMAFFIRYEIWVNYISELQKRAIPHFLVSATLRKGSGLLKWPMSLLYGPAFRSFAHIFAQDKDVKRLLETHYKVGAIQMSGNTRIDRVCQIAEKSRADEAVARFVGDDFCVIMGSSLEKDEYIFLEAYQTLKTLPIKWIIAPHEIHQEAIEAFIQQSPTEMLPYSRIEQLNPTHKMLWIDNIGMLAGLYRFADIAYIGGGFSKMGIHSIMEPAAFGVPSAFGPNHRNYEEALALLEQKAAFIIRDAQELTHFVRSQFEHPDQLKEIRKNVHAYAQSKKGATQQILHFLQVHHYL